MKARTQTQRHVLRLEASADTTHGVCSCGAWQHEAGSETVTVTGRSREDAIRAAHALHARGDA